MDDLNCNSQINGAVFLKFLHKFLKITTEIIWLKKIYGR